MRNHKHLFLYLREFEVNVGMRKDINWNILFYLIKGVTVLPVDEDVMRSVEESVIELVVENEEVSQFSNEMV